MLNSHYKGVPVTATEPVFGYMSDAIGFEMRNQRFQLAAMNDTEPSAADIAAFENDLRERRVHVLIYNSQATEALTKRMLKLAKDSQRAEHERHRDAARRQDLPAMDDCRSSTRCRARCGEANGERIERRHDAWPSGRSRPTR